MLEFFLEGVLFCGFWWVWGLGWWRFGKVNKISHPMVGAHTAPTPSGYNHQKKTVGILNLPQSQRARGKPGKLGPQWSKGACAFKKEAAKCL